MRHSQFNSASEPNTSWRADIKDLLAIIQALQPPRFLIRMLENYIMNQKARMVGIAVNTNTAAYQVRSSPQIL